MDNIENEQLTEKILGKYTEEEFKEVLSFLPHQKLVEPIKKKPKEFLKETRGFRIDKLSLEKINEIYFNRISNKKDIILSSYFRKIENEFIQDINKSIFEDNSTEKGNINELSFEYIVENLIETKFKNHIDLYFKMVDRKLKRKEITFIKNNLNLLIGNKKREKELEEHFKVQNEENLKKVEEKNKKIINIKEKELKELNDKIKELELLLNQEKKYSDIEIEKQIEVTKQLKKTFNQKEFELSEEIKNINYEKQVVLEKNRKLIDENNDYKNRVNELKKLSEKKYIEQCGVFEERWIKENEELEKSKKNLIIDIEKLECLRNTINNEINLLYIEKNELEESIKIIDNKASDVVNNISKVIEKLQGQNNKNNINGKSVYIIEEKNNDINSNEIINNADDFIEDLADNLLTCGVLEEYSIDLAQYIYSILASKMNLLLIGYNTRKIAHAISNLVNNSDAKMLNIPLGYSNSGELINLVNSFNNEVILIENAIDIISENVYLPLIKEDKEKHIIFSLESAESIRMLPKSILNYMAIVNLDGILSFESSEEFLRGVTSKSVFDINIDNSIKKKCFKNLDKLKPAIKLNNATKINISEIIGIIEAINLNKGIYDFLMFSILTLCQENGTLNELEECISNLKLEDNMYNRLKSIIEDLNNNE